MGWSHILYKTPQPDELRGWSSDKSSPINVPDNVKKRLLSLFPELGDWDIFEHATISDKWPTKASHSAMCDYDCSSDKEYIDIAIIENTDGFIHFIAARKSSLKLLRMIMEEFGLNNAVYDQTLEVIDPYQNDD
jgi:hypothetical protein